MSTPTSGSCTVVEGNYKKEFGTNGPQSTTGSRIEHQVQVSKNAAIAASVGRQEVTTNGQSVTSMSKGVQGSFKSDMGVTGIKFNDQSMSNGDSMRETTLSHGFRPVDNLKLTGTAGVSSGTMGGAPTSGRTFGLTGEHQNNFGKTSFGLTDSTHKGPGWSEHSNSGSLRHDVPLPGASSLGASVNAMRTDTGFSSTGFGMHGSKDWGNPGTTSVDITRNLGQSPMGPSRTDTVSVDHRVPLSADTYVAPFASRSWSQTPSGFSSNNAFGFNFGWKL